MDVKTAITRIFHVFAGVDPASLGADWQSGIAEEIDSIRTNENSALLEISKILSLCEAGIGRQATGVEGWRYGVIALLRIISPSQTPAVRTFLLEMTKAGGDDADWEAVRAEAQRLTGGTSTAAADAQPPVNAASEWPAAEAVVENPQEAPLRQTVPVMHFDRSDTQPAAGFRADTSVTQPILPSYESPASQPSAQPLAPAYAQPPAVTYAQPLAAVQPAPKKSKRVRQKRAAPSGLRMPVRGLILPVILLFVAWLLALIISKPLYANSLLCVSVAAYCLLLGCALTLIMRRRYAFGAIILIAGALLSALSLGWTKIAYIQSGMTFFSMFSVPQLWIDLLIALIPAVLTALCAILLPRFLKSATSMFVYLACGLAVFVSSLIVMLLTMPVSSFLSVLFAVFSSLVFAAFLVAAALFVGKLKFDAKRKLSLGGAGLGWAIVCIILSLAALTMILLSEELNLLFFVNVMITAGIVMLILLLCKFRKGFVWYSAATAAVVLTGLMYFLLAFVVSESWLPIVLIAAAVAAAGPIVGYFLLKKRWDIEPAPKQIWNAPAAPAYAQTPQYRQPPQYQQPPQYVQPPQYQQPQRDPAQQNEIPPYQQN